MSDECQQRSSHRLTEFCVFLNVILAVDGWIFFVSQYKCGMLMGGNMYLGTRNVSSSGKACQPWAENSPHAVDGFIEDAFFPDGNKEAAENFCRNPDLRNHDGVWCYTMDTDTVWDYCDVCPGNYEDYDGCDLPDKGVTYQGDINVTKSLTPCQFWSNFSNQDHRFPEGSAKKAGNYCRNPTPNVTPAPWCYISGVGSKNWEYCDICRPFQGKVTAKEGTFYTTAVDRTADMSTVACIHWCMTYGFCMGVVTSTNSECWFFAKLGGASLNREGYRTYFVRRVCNPIDGGKKFHYVEVKGMEISEFPIAYPDIFKCSEAPKCDAICFKRRTCVFYEWELNDQVIIPIDTMPKYKMRTHGSGTRKVQRIPIRCEAALKAIEYTDESPDIPDDEETTTPRSTIPLVTPPPSMSKVKEKELYEQLLEDSRKAQLSSETTLKPVKEKTGLSIPILVGIAGAVIFALAAVGFAYYKIVYKKRTYKAEIKAQEKAKVRANLKKPGDKGEKTQLKKPSAHKNVTANNKKKNELLTSLSRQSKNHKARATGKQMTRTGMTLK